MYSSVNVFNYKVLGGIRFLEPENSKPKIEIKPYFAKDVDFVRCQTQTPSGKVMVSWKRLEGKIQLKIIVGDEVAVYYKGKKLPIGESLFNE